MHLRHVKGTLVCTWALTLLLAGAPGSAQQTDSTTVRDSSERAMAVLQRMAELLEQSPRFGVTIDIGFDAVQESGQKIEFSETLQMVLRRPDRLRADTTKRDGSKNGFVFDGKNLTVFHPQENVYAAVARPGAVDKAVAHLSMTQGQHPLPRRIVITYRHADGRPQFWAQFSDWSLRLPIRCSPIHRRRER